MYMNPDPDKAHRFDSLKQARAVMRGLRRVNRVHTFRIWDSKEPRPIVCVGKHPEHGGPSMDGFLSQTKPKD